MQSAIRELNDKWQMTVCRHLSPDASAENRLAAEFSYSPCFQCCARRLLLIVFSFSERIWAHVCNACFLNAALCDKPTKYFVVHSTFGTIEQKATSILDSWSSLRCIVTNVNFQQVVIRSCFKTGIYIWRRHDVRWRDCRISVNCQLNSLTAERTWETVFFSIPTAVYARSVYRWWHYGRPMSVRLWINFYKTIKTSHKVF